MSNYPAGVSDNHPYFNPPREIASAVECGADSALVIPSHAVKAALIEIGELLKRDGSSLKVGGSTSALKARALVRLAALQEQIAGLEQEAEYECPFNDEIDLEESECARWDCPVCGNERETDTMPEERDPDYEWDHRGEGR